VILQSGEAELLLRQLIADQVSRAVRHSQLSSIERSIAMELARMGEQSDARMLAMARSLVAGALHAVADAYAVGSREDDRDLEIRYENAICREVLDALDRADALAAPPGG